MLAAASVAVVPVSKNRVSLIYVLVCLALASLVWLVVDLGSRAADQPAGFLCWWGENPRVLYLLHLGLLGFVGLPAADWWYAGARPWLAGLQLLVILTATSLAAW